MSLRYHQSSFDSNRPMVWEEMPFEELWPWWPSWISERKDFSNSESLCHCDASHQVLAQSNLQLRRCHLKNFKIASMVAILDIGMVQLSQF